jgi:RNA polymerase sigma-70 factor (ECF subfamily)
MPDSTIERIIVTEHEGAGPEGFEAFYRATYARTVATLCALTSDLAEAQDCAQEAYARLWQRWANVAEYNDPASWVRTVGSRIAISRWRRARVAMRNLVRHGPLPLAAVPNPDSAAVIAALRQLPKPQQRVLVLHHMAGLPVAEIAAREGVAVGTIKARLHRGRAALVPLLSDEPTTIATDGEEALHA